MKPFNLEEAKAGKPVCTRDGRAARIISDDLQGEHPFAFAIATRDGMGEKVRTYNHSGEYYDSEESKHDLFMAHVTKTVWVNLYRRRDLSVYAGSATYPYEQDAKAASNYAHCYIGTFPITYEE